MIKIICWLVIGFFLLIEGADMLIDGSKNVAKKLHIPEIIIGLTIVAIGGSMPELFISIKSAMNGYADVAIGNVIGSNLCNLLLILGLSAIVRPIKFQEETMKVDIPVCMLFTIMFMLLCNTNQGISRIEGLSLLVLCTAYILYTIFQARETYEETKDKKVAQKYKEESTAKNIIYIIMGIACLSVGGDLTAENAKEFAELIGLSEKIVALTIVSLGTSLPELVTSILASYRGETDLAIGNIIGSNIFNIVLIIGVSSSITPLAFNSSYNLQLSLLILGLLLLLIFPYIPPKKKMTRKNGGIYLALYIAYIALLFII